MSVLTKVFVVLLTVFSIALSMLVVSAFARQEDWRASAQDWEVTAKAEMAKANTATQNAAIEQQRALDRHQQDIRAINDLKDRCDANVVKLAELERELADAKNKLAVEQGQATSLDQQNKLLLAALNRQEELVARLSRRSKELELRNVDLNDRVKELTVNVSMATSRIRALQQQISVMDGSPDSAAVTQIPGGPGIVEADIPMAMSPAMPSVVAPIRGEITSIQGNLASISVGSADGVAPGMTFLIYRRGGQGSKPMYLGSIRTTRVEATQAAGLIEQSVGDITAGDLVRDELSFARRG
ncbi:MAG: hypothetical protein JXQ75_04365 [Phycisphaerae bacterium]|nr:hypothetical protein [Phycisphaerae bacterium]